jgi:hypothetical protein
MAPAVVATVAAVLVAAVAAASAEPPQGQIDLIAGTVAGYAPPGDNVLASTARTNGPTDVSVLPNGNVLIADRNNNRIRRVDTAGIITTVAGDGTASFGGDGGPATAGQLNGPTGVAATSDGGFLIADTNNRRIRRVSPGGTITTVAGNGNDCQTVMPACGDGAAATAATLSVPTDVTPTPDGGYLIADPQVNVVRHVDGAGAITRVAGNYQAPGGFGGDGLLATTNPTVQLNSPVSVVMDPDGSFLIADSANYRIRRVSAVAGGIISTVAGNGTACAASTNPCGDGAAATAANLNVPHGVASRSDGSFFIGDTNNNRVRAVSVGGTISTVAGTGTAGNTGDGGAATTAQLNQPWGLAQCGNSLLFADFGNQRVRWFGLTPLAGATPCVPAPTPPQPTPTPNPTTTTPPQPPPVGPLLPPVARPQTGVSIVAETVSGTVLIRRPGERVFSPLGTATNLPIGTEFDTRHGTVRITFATGQDDPHSTDVSKGLFRTRQKTATGSVLELDLTGKLGRCPRGRAHVAKQDLTPFRKAVAARTRSRQVAVRAKGPVKSRGRYASATVRGTEWTMKDTCNGTLTLKAGTLVRVTEGVVAVADFVRHKTVTVKAGKRYFAAARPRR